VRGYTDLHSHWVAAIDDGVRTPDEGEALLRGLYAAGFSTVVATPHMRPGMFDNDKDSLTAAYERTRATFPAGAKDLPTVHLASEHFFDDIVFRRLVSGQGLPYPGGKSVLIELSPQAFPAFLQHRLFDVRRAGLRVVIAHPERYQPVWKDLTCLEPLLDAGVRLLLDLCSLVGKYGRAAQRAAEELLEEEAYDAACSDAHKPADVAAVEKSLKRLEALAGPEGLEKLLAQGPNRILAGS
jgi:protein-tyrosine phosphatase